MATHNIKNLRFTPLSEETLRDFKAPTTAHLYNNQTERAAVLNKFNFTQEIVYSKDPKKEQLIEKLEGEFPKLSQKMKVETEILEEAKKTIGNKKALQEIESYTKEIDKLHSEYKKKEYKIKDSEIEPLFVASLSSSSKEYLENTVGIDTSIRVPYSEIEELRNNLKIGKITNEQYEKQYESLQIANSSFTVSSKFIRGILKFFEEELKGQQGPDGPRQNTKLKEIVDSNLPGLNTSLTLYNVEGHIEDSFILDKNINSVVTVAYSMIAMNPENMVLMDEAMDRKMKDEYANQGTENLFVRTLNGKTYVSEVDIKRLQTRNSHSDMTDIIKLLQVGFEAISDEKLQRGMEDITYKYYDVLWKEEMKRESVIYRVERFNNIQKRKHLGAMMWIGKSGEDTKSNDGYNDIQDLSEKIIEKLISKYPYHIKDHINKESLIYKYRSRITTRLDLKKSSIINAANEIKLEDFETMTSDKYVSRIIDVFKDVFEKEFLYKNFVDNSYSGEYYYTSQGKEACRAIVKKTSEVILEKFSDPEFYRNSQLYKRFKNRIEKDFNFAAEATVPRGYINTYKISPKTLTPVKKYPASHFRFDKERFEDMKERINLLERLNVAKGFQGGERAELSEIIKLETERSDKVDFYNSQVMKYRKAMDNKKDIYESIISVGESLRKLKVENHVITNNVDKEKMMTMMKAIVKMSMTGENRDKIIDLTDVESIDGNLGEMFEEFNLVTSELLAMTYINDMNSLYIDKGIDAEYETMELNTLQSFMALGGNSLFMDAKRAKSPGRFVTEEFKTLDDGSREKVDIIKIYEGKHFPLFIDKEDYTIWSLEWTGRYPTIQVSMMAPELIQAVKNKSTELFYEKKGLTPNKLKDKEYIDVIAQDFKEFYVGLAKDMGRFSDGKILNEKFLRMAEIFSMIQANYFIQMEQIEDRSLFVDVSPYYDRDATMNPGTVSFLNLTDTNALANFEEYKNISKSSKVDVNKYIDPFNFKLVSGKKLIDVGIIKKNGFKPEEESKNEMREIISTVSELSKDESFENSEVMVKKAIRYMYADKTISKYYFPDTIIEILEAKKDSLRLFPNIEDLDRYRDEYDRVMSREFDFIGVDQ